MPGFGLDQVPFSLGGIMASFNDILRSQPQSLAGHHCQTGLWRDKLDPADREEFDAACADRSLQAVAIFRTMRAMGFKGGDTAFLRHRNGGCRCGEIR